jgi:hypothetical protein
MTTARRLAAILAADVAGYSRLIGAGEEGTLDRPHETSGLSRTVDTTPYQGRLR